MIKTITKQQFLSNIFTLRFSISFIACILLFTASALILNWDYSERLSYYSSNVAESEEELKNIRTYAQLRVRINKPPAPLSTISEGIDKKTGTSVEVGFDQAPTITDMEESGSRNALLAVFPTLDITTIIQIILSLMALLFSYNVISGEREKGTLKLIFSNSIPRHRVVLGKFIGGLGSIIVPLTAGLLIALIITILNPMANLNLNHFFRIFIIFILSLLYLGLFYSLGMLFSTRIRRSSTVLISLLLIWVIFVLIIPQASVYSAKQLIRIPDKTEIDNQQQALLREWYRELQNYTSKHPKPEPYLVKDKHVMTGSLPYAYRIRYGSKESMQWHIEGSIFGHNLRMEYEDKISRLYNEYQSKLKKQSNIANIFSMISPSYLFYSSVSSISGTDDNNLIRFLKQAQNYRTSLIKYMKDKNGLSSYKLITKQPLESFLTYQQIINIRTNQGDEAFINIIENQERDPEFLNLSDLPRFDYKFQPLSASVKNTFIEIILLIFLNIVFFSLTWIVFLRADVR